MTRLLWGAIGAMSLALASCGGSGDVSNELAIRVIHASADAPPVNLLLDGVILRPGVEYKAGTGYLFLTPRSYLLGIEALLPQGNAIIAETEGPLEAGFQRTVLVIGKAADQSVELVPIEHVFERIPSDRARVEIFHAAPDAPPVNFTLISATPGSVPAVDTTLEYKQAPFGRELIDPATDYSLEISLAADPATVLYRVPSLVVAAGRDLLFVIVPNTATGLSPVTLLVNDGFNSGELQDADTTSDVRVVHAAPDTPALNVVADPAVEENPEIPLATGLTYLQFTGYVPVPPANYAIRGVLTSDPTPETPPFTVARTLIQGQRTTLLATGLRGSDPATFDDLALQDDVRVVALYGKVRIIDAAPAGATVDLYLLTTGTDIATVDATIAGLTLRAQTGHLRIAPGEYTATFTTAGTKMVLASVDLGEVRGRVQTVVLVDEVRLLPADDGLPLDILVIDDTL